LDIASEIKSVSHTIKSPFAYILSEIIFLRAPEDMGTCMLHVDDDGNKWGSLDEFADNFPDDFPDEDILSEWDSMELQGFYEVDVAKNVFFTKQALLQHVGEYRHLYNSKLSWRLVHCLKNGEMETLFDILQKKPESKMLWKSLKNCDRYMPWMRK